MFTPDVNAQLNLDHNPTRVKAFLTETFRYYTGLYARLWSASKTENAAYPAVFFNGLNELDSQFMLVLSACGPNDPEEAEKIRLVAHGLDRIFSLLQLQGAYDSNEFATRLYGISVEIRDKPTEIISQVFEKHLMLELTERRGVAVAQGFSYALFRPISLDRLNTRFTRYVFGRVERLLADAMKVKMKQEIKDLVTLRGTKTGFHVEHILSRNDENMKLFENDEERFDQERNRLGGVLLLKGKDNISSSNEAFSQKLKSYANTLYWNETLREDTYKSKLDFTAFVESKKLKFRHLSTFGPMELEERQKLLFDLAELIWAI